MFVAEETKRGGVPQEKLLELRHIRKVSVSYTHLTLPTIRLV